MINNLLKNQKVKIRDFQKLTQEEFFVNLEQFKVFQTGNKI